VSPLLARLIRYGRLRGQPWGLAVCAALLTQLGLPEPPPPTVEGLSRMLAAAGGLEVRATEVVWEPRGDALTELTRGRPILFLGARPGELRDVYRARVRVTPRGQPIAVRALENLTRTANADEALLIGQGTRAAFVTVRAERVLAVTLLEGLASRKTSRTDLIVERSAGRAEVSLDRARLTVDLGEGGHAYELSNGRFAADPKGALRIVTRNAASPGARLSLVEAARDLGGPNLVELAGRAILFVKALECRAVALLTGGTRIEKATPVVHPLLRRAPNDALDPLFFRGVTAPPGAPGGARIVLVRMDMRQLELGVEAGSETPTASADVPGEGRLPGGALRSRVVAVFNGGDESVRRHGAVAGGRLLTPPTPGLPSLRATTGHELLLGAFPEDGRVGPHLLGVTQWERSLTGDVDARPGDASVRRRSALCATGSGGLLYAFAESVDRASLSRALRASGCVAAFPLAASPERLGFALVGKTDPADPKFELLDGAMDFDVEATFRGSTRDFFYLSRRETTPAAPGVTFTPDGGTQPPPSWAPGIFSAETTMGGLAVRLVSFERGHFDYRLRAGPREIGARGEPWAGAFAEADATRALAALELGHATAANRYGLVLGASVPLPVKPAFATLVIGEGTAARILLPGETVTLASGEQAVQLPLLADDRDVTERARERGAARARAALGVVDGGRIVVAFATHDSSDPLAVALRNAGCRRVVELDRGSHHPAFLHRAGTPAPPRTDYESTTLWALSRDMRPAVVVTD
jgi:hypothetical protein